LKVETGSTVSLRQVAFAAAALLALAIAGSIGFHFILDESYFDGFYRTITTVTTVGLASIPQSFAARLFTIALIVWGVAVFLWFVGLVVELTVRGTVTGVWNERRMRRRVEHLHDHYVICGYGRVGQRVAGEFRAAGVPYVVLDFNPDSLAIAAERGELAVDGTGTNDADLEAAGLARARGLVVSSDSDIDNLYITLSARTLRPELFIVARASNDDVAEKLRRAGADRVIQPYDTAGQEMAKLVLKPQVAAFLEMVSTRGGPDMSFEEISVSRSSGLVGTTLAEIRVQERTGAVVIGVRRLDGSFDATPNPETRLAAGDVVIAIGSPDELKALEDLFRAESLDAEPET
jgi:voltage-gated potassium channel